MGHESRIEPWLPPDNRSAYELQSGLASLRRSDGNRWERKPNPLGCRAQHSRGWHGQSEPLRFKYVGLEAKETPAVVEIFSLDIPVYRTFRDFSGRIHLGFKVRPGDNFQRVLIRLFIWARLSLRNDEARGVVKHGRQLVNPPASAPISTIFSISPCDLINFGRNGWAGAERRMVPREEMSELLPVNSANEHIQAPVSCFLRKGGLMATRIV
jgi:hypothetical protein